MNNFGEKVSFIWGVADLIRDTFKRGKYQDVILPFTVLRRLDCVLESTKEQVLEAYNKHKDELDRPNLLLCSESDLLYLVTEKFKNIDLHPDKVSNLEMGYIFEELIRKFNEALDENPGEQNTSPLEKLSS